VVLSKACHQAAPAHKQEHAPARPSTHTHASGPPFCCACRTSGGATCPGREGGAVVGLVGEGVVLVEKECRGNVREGPREHQHLPRKGGRTGVQMNALKNESNATRADRAAEAPRRACSGARCRPRRARAGRCRTFQPHRRGRRVKGMLRGRPGERVGAPRAPMQRGC